MGVEKVEITSTLLESTEVDKVEPIIREVEIVHMDAVLVERTVPVSARIVNVLILVVEQKREVVYRSVSVVSPVPTRVERVV